MLFALLETNFRLVSQKVPTSNPGSPSDFWHWDQDAEREVPREKNVRNSHYQVLAWHVRTGRVRDSSRERHPGILSWRSRGSGSLLPLRGGWGGRGGKKPAQNEFMVGTQEIGVDWLNDNSLSQCLNWGTLGYAEVTNKLPDLNSLTQQRFSFGGK